MNEILISVLFLFAVFVSIFLALFLFWRACRHELFDNEQIFDILLIGSAGGLLAGRIVGFFFNFQTFGFSLYKFFFFHVYQAFSFWGFILGAFLTICIFLRHKRTSVWAFCDLAAAPIVFGLFFHSLAFGLLSYFKTGFDFPLLGLSLFYFIFYFTLKRLATKKRHAGFFACLFFVFCPIFNILYLLLTKKWSSIEVGGLYELVFLGGIVLLGLFSWHRLAKRKLSEDVRLVFGFVFLRLLGFLRAISSADEAGRIARIVILFPYSILRTFLLLLRGLFREIKLGLVEFFYILGIRR